jgi:hypothetical protein
MTCEKGRYLRPAADGSAPVLSEPYVAIRSGFFGCGCVALRHS